MWACWWRALDHGEFGNRVKTGSKPYNPSIEKNKIQDFWGQLWYIPNRLTSLHRARVRDRKGENLVWNKRELWRSKSFNPSSCYPIGEGDF